MSRFTVLVFVVRRLSSAWYDELWIVTVGGHRIDNGRPWMVQAQF